MWLIIEALVEEPPHLCLIVETVVEEPLHLCLIVETLIEEPPHLCLITETLAQDHKNRAVEVESATVGYLASTSGLSMYWSEASRFR